MRVLCRSLARRSERGSEWLRVHFFSSPPHQHHHHTSQPNCWDSCPVSVWKICVSMCERWVVGCCCDRGQCYCCCCCCNLFGYIIVFVVDDDHLYNSTTISIILCITSFLCHLFDIELCYCLCLLSSERQCSLLSSLQPLNVSEFIWCLSMFYCLPVSGELLWSYN